MVDALREPLHMSFSTAPNQTKPNAIFSHSFTKYDIQLSFSASLMRLYEY